MIYIPYSFDGFIINKLKQYTVANLVDHLNYCLTSRLLGFFAVALAGGQYFGSPITCWTPKEFKPHWEDYTEDYCFIANSYHVPLDHYHLPKHGDPARGDRYSYYRWVPIVLAIQAICFFLPKFFWSRMNQHTTIDLEGYMKEAQKVSGLLGKQKEDEIATLAENILIDLSAFGKKGSFFRGRWGPLLYLLTKSLYVFNICLQFLLMTTFLGQNDIHWGYNLAYKLYQGVEEDDSLVFPRVIMCDFKIRTIANSHPYTIQCLLPLNYINEKLYLALYFWFIFLAIVNGLSCLYQFVMTFMPCLQSRTIRKTLSKNKNSNRVHSKDVSQFISDKLCPDGVLLLDFIAIDSGSLFCSKLISNMFDQYVSMSQ